MLSVLLGRGLASCLILEAVMFDRISFNSHLRSGLLGVLMCSLLLKGLLLTRRLSKGGMPLPCAAHGRWSSTSILLQVPLPMGGEEDRALAPRTLP